jgi:enoyl-CoA hydratase/carnithine racemase
VSADEVVVVRLPSRAGALWPALATAGRSLTGAVRVVVLRGETADFFDGSASAPDGTGPGESLDWLRRHDLITIAVLTGRATGAGLALAMACDLRLAADDAELAVPGGDGLLWEPVEGMERVVDALGYARSFELAVTGRRLSGREAAALGLVNLAIPSGGLEAAVDDLVGAVLATPRTAATLTKAMLAASGDDRRRRMGEIAAAFRLSEGEL